MANQHGEAMPFPSNRLTQPSLRRKALAFWSRRPLAERITSLEAFAGDLQERKDELVEAISSETGKPNWEAASEVDTMIRKVPLSISAYRERRRPSESESGGELSATRYKPHGVAAVFGPFNFPGHLPNGHIVPACWRGIPLFSNRANRRRW